MRIVAWCGLALALGVCSCGEKQDPFGPDVVIEGTITYTSNVKALLDANCIRCHASSKQGAARNGAPPGYNYESYAEASATAEYANERIQSGLMPPGGPALAPIEKATFQAWLDQGLLE